MNLVEGLQAELKRNNELLEVYKRLPNNAGWFGALAIKENIERGEKALASGDAVEMLAIFSALKENE